MSRTLISNITHFLDEKGAIPESLPNRARKLAEQLGHIVSSVTFQPNKIAATPLLCAGMVSKKRCTGKIDAGIDMGNLDIFWHCLKCGDNDSISHWQNTFWDGGHR